LAEAHQLDFLRRRMAAASARAAAEVEARLAQRIETLHTSLADVIDGEEIQTAHGCHFETRRTWERHRRHGSMDISNLLELPPDLLAEITEQAAPKLDPARCAFLDTETTGLVGGSGTCAFLVGIGRITPVGFIVKQYFMRDYSEEASMLSAITAELSEVDVLITYNGKTFDIPLLETRYRLSRARPPFANLHHLDLLHGARRLWRLRFESCRLVHLEARILGHERHGDVAGDLIPQIYFDYVRTGKALSLAPIFTHNQLDIVTLACLTAIVPLAFQDVARIQAHPAELVSLGRWLRQAGRTEEARQLFRRALQGHLTDELMFRTMWDLAELDRKAGDRDSAIALYHELATARRQHCVAAMEQLALHYERRERHHALALEFTESALAIEPSEALLKRRERLRLRLATPKSASLL
jgi:uncharacterized protein YprB with RNaseH-like and TPR domain